MTTSEPGARLVFTQGGTPRPRARALRASSPAPIMTAGLEVLVHEVIAAITTAPSASVKRLPSRTASAAPPAPGLRLARSSR